jgi:hypothetical protein
LAQTAPVHELQTTHSREEFSMRIRCELICQSGQRLPLVIEALPVNKAAALPRHALPESPDRQN